MKISTFFNTDIIQMGFCHSRETTTVPPPPGASKKENKLSRRNFKDKLPYFPSDFQCGTLKEVPRELHL